MRCRAGWLLLSVVVLASCSGRREAVRAAEPHMEEFARMRGQALELLELRADMEQKKALLEASEADPESVPDNLKPLLERMRAENVELTVEQLQAGEALFWRMLDKAFADNPSVMQAEIAFIEKDGTISRFRSPRDREIPAGIKWFGLREQRTFAGLGRCMTDVGSEPCVLIQRRPRDYAGSAGLTVAFREGP
ncbi:MAG: hypothetical protein JRE81_08425 [Deltaproteobacteria bacterium]|nr:hypothetical protein [Deltaproteobacteria bacterium]